MSLVENKIFIDLDDTLLDTFRYFVKWFDRPEPYNSIDSIIKLCNGGPITREVTQLDMTHAESWESLPLEFWDSIPLMPWANDLISLCERLAGKENVYILSSQIPTEACVSGKTYSVNSHFPSYRNRLILSRNKQIIVDKHSLLIDDYTGHLLKFVQANKIKNFFLFPSLCNVLHDTAKSMLRINGHFSLDPTHSILKLIEDRFIQLQDKQ